MTVRFAIREDLPDLVDLVRNAHIESRFAWMSFNARASWRFIDNRIGRANACVLVAHRDGELVGGLLADTHTHWFSGTKYIWLRAVYVRKEHRGGLSAVKMLHGLRRWATNVQAAELRIEETFLEPDARVERVFRKLGYQPTGKVWSTWLTT